MMKRTVCILSAVLVFLSGFSIIACAEEFFPSDSQYEIILEDEYAEQFSEQDDTQSEDSYYDDDQYDIQTEDSYDEQNDVQAEEATEDDYVSHYDGNYDIQVEEPTESSSADVPEIASEVPSTRQAPRLVDYANIIPDNDEKELLALLDSISEEKKFDVVVVTTNSTGERTPMEFADDYFDYGGFGYGENHDGIVLMIDNGGGNYWISASGSGTRMFSNSRCDSLSNYFIDELISEDFSSACRYYAEGTRSMINGFKRRPFILILISIAIGYIFSGSIINGMKEKHQTVVPKVKATNYQIAESLALVQKSDNFLFSNVSKMPIMQQARAPVGGGGIHMSSSGSMHTGSGGSFR